MSRRREAREQEATTFLQQNPTLIEYNTRIEPAQDDKGRYVLEVTQDGNEPEQTDATTISVSFNKWGIPKIEGDAIPGLITVQDDIEAPGADLDASYSYSDWRGRPKEGDASVSISELGIGVTSGGDLINLGVEIVKGDLGPEDLVKFGTISDNESLEVEVDDDAPEGAVVPDSEDFPFLELSGREVGVGFDVISGSGKIVITLIDYDTKEIETMEFDTFAEIAGRGRRTTQVEVDHITAEMADGGQFDKVMISTTGDLEITVTGIDLVSGYSEGMMYPI